MGKFDDLIYTLPAEYHHWDGYASPRAGYGGNQVRPNSHMYMGFSVATREGVMEVPHIHHAVDEYLVFTGADMTDFYGSFDAEVEVWLGDDPLKMEKIAITGPTIIRVPPNLWHCPISFKRVGKPVCFIPLYLDGDWSKINRETDADGRDFFVYDGAGIRRCVKDRSKLCTYCGACFSENGKKQKDEGGGDLLAPYREMEKNGRTGIFGKYVYRIKPENHPLGDAFVSPRACYPGIFADKNARVCFNYDTVKEPCVLLNQPHMHHCADEYLFFTGWNLVNPFDSFDAEIELLIGPDPDHMEKYVITEPAAVRIPPNVWHCPISFKRIGQPVNFMPFYLDGCWTTITRETGPDGRYKYIYQGMGLPEE